LASVAALTIGAPSSAQVPVEIVVQGGTVQLIPATTCGLPTDTVPNVTPAQAGTVAVGSNGCGMSFTASSTFVGFTTFGWPTTTCGIPANATTRVIPAQAGTVAIGANGCGVRFTAARTAFGNVQVIIEQPGPGAPTNSFERWIIRAPANFVNPTASASGSFTPVAPPPPPGPCILDTANPVVAFGDVTLGGPYRNGNVAPTVAGCAAPEVEQDVLVQASSATNGSTTLDTDTSCLAPVNCDPTEGFYSVALPEFVITVRSVPGLWRNAQPGNFTDQAVALAVKMPATLAPTFVGSVFTFDVTFTAVID